MAEPAICVQGGSGLVLPLFGAAEQDLPRGLRVFMYLLGLGYCFMGVAIIADVFMGAIEKVTSKKVRRYDASKKKWYTFEVWNPTVANLSLMALGSSAPEILLNVIGIFSDEFYAGELGPSTIVGSAAFNFLVIIAVCIVAIPAGEVRRIKEMPVYMVTASCSIFAYVWLLIVLLVSSPNVVDVWEGVFTFLFFPILCVLAFLADKGYCRGAADTKKKNLLVHEAMTAEELATIDAKVRAEHGQDLSDEQVSRIVAALTPRPPSRAAYRVEATRRLFGGKKVKVIGSSATTSVNRSMSRLVDGSSKKVHPFDDPISSNAENLEKMGADCLFQFQHARKAVLENVGAVTVKVQRIGNLDFPAHVHYRTEDGEAKADGDYMPVDGKLAFEAGQSEAEFTITIIDDAAYEEDEEFYVELYSPEAAVSDKSAGLGETTKMTLVIIDNDDPGVIGFPSETMVVAQQTSQDGFNVEIKVQRRRAASGDVSISWRTEGDTAVPGRDYEEASGELEFLDKQAEASIFIKILAQSRYESSDRFRVFLEDPQGGAKLDPTTDGGEQRDILTVSIEADAQARDRIDKIKSHLQTKWDKSKIGHANWASQFKAALYVNGGEEEDDDEEPGCLDKCMHWITVPWKLLFAIVPPTNYCDGWLCFFCSLAMIGVVTLIIGEMAGLLGCVMCISDDITAITFVALGTSLPDLFASMSAATQDPSADASVGNVTGSNSVNVFLGLGLPWMIASMYWSTVGPDAKWISRYGPAGLDVFPNDPRQAFVVEAGSLSFSVTIFCCCALTGMVILGVRRTYFGGALGGPTVPKYVSGAIFLAMWFFYISMSIWKSVQTTPLSCAS